MFPLVCGGGSSKYHCTQAAIEVRLSIIACGMVYLRPKERKEDYNQKWRWSRTNDSCSKDPAGIWSATRTFVSKLSNGRTNLEPLNIGVNRPFELYYRELHHKWQSVNKDVIKSGYLKKLSRRKFSDMLPWAWRGYCEIFKKFVHRSIDCVRRGCSYFRGWHGG